MCNKTCIFCFFPIINKYLCMAKRSLLSELTAYTSIKLLCSMAICFFSPFSFFLSFFLSFFIISTSLNSQQKFQLLLASDPTKNFTNFLTHKIRGIDCERTMYNLHEVFTYFLTLCRLASRGHSHLPPDSQPVLLSVEHLLGLMTQH